MVHAQNMPNLRAQLLYIIAISLLSKFFTNVELVSDVKNVRFEDVHFADSLLTLSYRQNKTLQLRHIQNGNPRDLCASEGGRDVKPPRLPHMMN